MRRGDVALMYGTTRLQSYVAVREPALIRARTIASNV
jgi:hypothetical protein